MHELCRFLAAAAWALVNDDYRRASQGIACCEVFGKIWACIFHDTACQGVIHMQEKNLVRGRRVQRKSKEISQFLRMSRQP
jgi:hypothetical protein